MVDLAGVKLRAKWALVTVDVQRRRLRRRLWTALPEALRRAEVVTGFGTQAYVAGLVDALSGVLERAGIEHLVIETRLLPQPQVVVDAADRTRVLRALRRDPAAARWWLAIARGGPVGRPSPVRGRPRLSAGATGVVVSRNLVSPTGVPLTDSETGVLVSFWTRLAHDVPANGGGTVVGGTLVAPAPTGVLDRADPELWAAAQADGHRLRWPHPHLLLVNEPVDLVYTWVDGSDPAWLERKAAATGGPAVLPSDAAIAARFQDRDELRYSLRSVQMFADWVRRIWIVTDRQVPAWLVPDERLRVVDHTEVFADPSVLPVFNSHAIESQLHHIPGLASHYLYLNDDMLFGGPARPEDFFTGDRLAKFFVSSARIDLGGHRDADLAVTAAAKNSRDFIEQAFGQTITRKLRHAPYAHLREVMEDFERNHPAIFDTVMRSRLRSHADHPLCSSLGQYYAYATGRAVVGGITNGYVDLGSESSGFVLRSWLRRRAWQVLCLNDSGTGDPATAARRDLVLAEFLESYFPLPSRWERTGDPTPNGDR